MAVTVLHHRILHHAILQEALVALVLDKLPYLVQGIPDVHEVDAIIPHREGSASP